MKLFNIHPTALLSLFFLSIAFYGSAQNEPVLTCDTHFSKENQAYYKPLIPQIKKFEDQFLKLKSNTGKSSMTTLKNAIPIKAHIIRSSNGSGGLTVSELHNIINNLNTVFIDAYFEFYLSDGINYINNDAFCHFNRLDENTLTNANNVANVINIYFTDYIENASNSSICGYTNNIGKQDVILMKNDCAKNKSSLAHEIGHLFSLMHTHGKDSNSITTELVNGSNCDTDGDGICDTPADPKLNANSVNNFCKFTDVIFDANGEPFNPDTQNIMSYSKKGCRSHFSKQQLARMFAFYKLVKNYYNSPSFNADFTSDNTQTCHSELTVAFNAKCENATTWEWDVDSDGIIDYHTKNPTHTFNTGRYNVTLKVSNQTNTISKTHFNYIQIGTLKTTPFIEDFEDFVITNHKGWTTNHTSKSGYNWFINYRNTQTEGIGIQFDNALKTRSDTYLYAKASGAQMGDVAEFISPCIEINQSHTVLEFAYQLFGKNMSELHIDISSDLGLKQDIITPIKGQAQNNKDDAFLIQTVDLSSFKNQTIKIHFRAVRGASWDANIAIDNINIREQNNIESSFVKAFSAKVYPNPLTGETLYIQTNNYKETVNYSISNLVGQNFTQGTVYNNSINLSQLHKGTYLLRLQSGNTTIIKKIIK